MTFGILGNINKPQLPAVVRELIRVFEDKKTDYLLENKLALLILKKFGKKVPYSNRCSLLKIVSSSDFIISIGGDGTFLHTAKLVGAGKVPVIGLNLGKLGFLAEKSAGEISGFIDEILKKKYIIEERSVLTASPAGFKEKKIFGLNEIVIHQGGAVKTIEIQVYFNNKLVISYLADGLIVSTPTGSTGYSLSAGGPIVYPGCDDIILSPMYPHTLTARHMVLPDNGTIKIKVVSKVPVFATADGISTFSLRNPSEVVVKKAAYRIRLVKSRDSNYFKVLNQKLLWGEDVRKHKKI